MTSLPVPLIDLKVVHRPIVDELVAAAERVIRSGNYTAGAGVSAFESELAAYCGTTHALGVASGTSSINMMLTAAGIGPGDEVIVPANTFWASVEGIHHAGAVPVLVDVDENTANIDPGAVEAAITPRTAAILAVHLYGQPAAMSNLRKIADAHNLGLFEDSAQAIGAEWEGVKAGALGDAASFSFYPGKNLGALGEAGGVTTSRDDIAEKVRRLRSHGEARKYVHVDMGYNERLDEIQAAFLSIKLRRLDEDQVLRDDVVRRYRQAFAGHPGIGMFATDPRAKHVHHLFVVQVDRRDAVLDALRAVGVGASIHYPTPVHLQEGGRHLAEAMADRILTLPLFPGMTDEQVQHCITSLINSLGESTAR
jgi:dTDP-4-amino-4,6-dideoxygalactose transaminase